MAGPYEYPSLDFNPLLANAELGMTTLSETPLKNNAFDDCPISVISKPHNQVQWLEIHFVRIEGITRLIIKVKTNDCSPYARVNVS